MIRITLVALVRNFPLELDLLKTNPAMSMLTNCSQNWWITLEQQEVRSCPFCIQLSFLDESCANDVKDELVPEFDDNASTTRGTKLSVSYVIVFTSLVNRGV